jgi:proteasome inhibitor subunit 1 (PI31)
MCSGWAPERPPGFFGGVGDQDRFPAGMPFIPPLGPVVPPGRGGGGMLIGPDHPAFFPGGGAPGHPPQLPPGVPPGARFDPYGKKRPAA